MHLHSEQNDLLSLTYFEYVPQMSDPFVFHAAFTISGFTYKQRVSFSHQALMNFRAAIDRLSYSGYHVATLATEDGTFVVQIQPYGKRGYVLSRATVSFATKPTLAEGILIDNHFAGGFVAEPARLGEWVGEVTTIITSRDDSS